MQLRCDVCGEVLTHGGRLSCAITLLDSPVHVSVACACYQPEDLSGGEELCLCDGCAAVVAARVGSLAKALRRRQREARAVVEGPTPKPDGTLPETPPPTNQMPPDQQQPPPPHMPGVKEATEAVKAWGKAAAALVKRVDDIERQNAAHPGT